MSWILLKEKCRIASYIRTMINKLANHLGWWMLTVYPHCMQESRLASKPVNGDDGTPDKDVFVDSRLSMPLLVVNKRWHSVSMAPESNWKNSWASCWSRLMMTLWWVVRAVTISTGLNAVRRSSDLDKSRIVFNNDLETGCVCSCGLFRYVWSLGNDDKACIACENNEY